MPFQRILAPVDYSEPSRNALSFAAEIAQSFGGSLDIVHVWDRPTYASEAVLVGHGASQRPLGELIRENAERDMKQFLSQIELPSGVPRTERLVSGDPASALLKEIENGSYDLVVVGTHGRSGFAHFMLGSIAEKLVRYSKVPVLTVPAKRQPA